MIGTLAEAPASPASAETASAETARPFLKWAGGKTQLLPELLKRVPDDPPAYHEPFVGSGALFFALRPANATLSDANEELVNVWRLIQDDVERLIDELAKLEGRNEEDEFYRIRAERPRGDVKRAARLIYLNKTCFNGLYRTNRKGEFNVPFGRHRNPTVCNAANLRACSAALEGVRIECSPFEAVLDRAAEGDFVYFDPPYDPVSATALFTSYHRDDFGRPEQQRLAEVFAELAGRGCRVLLSNSDTAFVRGLYADFVIETVYARRQINRDPSRRGEVTEVLVSPR